MRGIGKVSPFICARCLRANRAVSNVKPAYNVRHASNPASPPRTAEDGDHTQPRQEEEQGAMSRRLSQMSEENIETGGRSAAKAVEEAGFSEDLKRQLEEKIANAKFRSENPQAFAQVNMPAGAGKGTRDIAASEPWSGTESVHDATLRMLTDAHKPVRAPPRVPGVRGPPARVDTGRPKNKGSGAATGKRIANARDKTSMYEFTKDAGLSEQEREKFRQQLKQRFAPAARATPATIQGLASLANERIEDAIASGKFKNLPRGQKIEKDHNASSPFIDTTEYLMNKIIQRQEIVPPWIEKQQELVTTATRFRSRLRADWRRHVSRVISSRGGGLDKQMQMAKEYAFAESVENPSKKKEEKLNAVETQPEQTVTISTEQPEQAASAAQPSQSNPRRPTVSPFRDPQWEQTERAYLTVAIDNLNKIARSYNLMAPPIARKPYYYLDRELKACFADVAPQVAGYIKERALAPKVKGVEVSCKSRY